MEGAARYKVAAKLANGVKPFVWRVYQTSSPPYAITEPAGSMSGLEYEIRVAAVTNVHGNDGQSAWSPPSRVTASALRPAPADAIDVARAGPYEPGDVIRVNLRSQRPFARRSPWIWSACDEPDGSGCELLPLSGLPTHSYRVPKEASGKRIQVQVDYDKDGSSYTATAVLGVVSGESLAPSWCGTAPPANSNAFTAGAPLHTHLHYLEQESVQVPWDDAKGGAMEALCNDLLVATPWGRIGVVHPDGGLAHLDDRVPMNVEELLSSSDAAGYSTGFRVADILLKRSRSEEPWELFVTHHYFTGKCIRLRLSAARVLQRGESGLASSGWRTIFDADPCASVPSHESLDLRRAGGRILLDGPEHLLLAIGDHGLFGSQSAESHFGKLVRVAIQTGEAQTLSLGLRNPQGFVRDASGDLWATDHGPHGGDELNLLRFGANYGWPLVSYGLRGILGRRVRPPPRVISRYRKVLRTPPDRSAGTHAGFARPRFSWVPSIGVSAMVVNDGRSFPLWQDDLLVGSLADESRGRSIFRVRRHGKDVQYVERIRVGYRIRDMTWMVDGRMALLADDGRVFFLSRSSEYCDERSWQLGLAYAVDCDALGGGDAPSRAKLRD